MPNPFSIRPSDLLYLTQHRLCAETLYILNWYKPRYNLSPTYNYTTHYIDSDTGTGTGTGIGILVWLIRPEHTYGSVERYE